MAVRLSEVAAAWRGRAERVPQTVTPLAGLVAVVVLGAVLRSMRLQQLGDFDFDEVASVWYARSLPLDIIAAIAEAPFEHPPLYYVALHYWTTWFGEQEPIVRWLSVPFGVLLIPATYQLARLYLRPWPAVFAAGVVAVSPMLVFFSREARMYAAAALFGTLALWLFERAMRRGRRRDWVWLALTIVIGAYVDYTAALAVVAMNLTLPWRFRQQRRRVVAFVAIELACVAAALPWVLLARGVQDSLPAFGSGSLGLGLIQEVAASAWLDVFVGDAAVRGGGRAGALVAGVLGALVIVGAALALARRTAGLLLAQVAAVLGFLALLLIFDKDYQSRYLLPAIPTLAVVAAIPLSLAPRRAWVMAPAAAVVVAALAGPVYASRAYYDDYRRGDYRSITATIENLARPQRPDRDGGKFRDAVVLAGPWQGWYWRHYFPGFLDKVDVWFLPEEVPPAVTAEEVKKKLQRAADNHRRLWVVLAGLEQADPEGHVEAWLSSQWQARSEIYRNGVLQLYMTNVLDLVNRRGYVKLDQDFEIERVQFSGARADQGPREAGDGVRFTVFVRAMRSVDYDLRLRVWLRTPSGVIYAKDLYAQDRFLRRTSQWQAGDEHQLRTALWVPAEAEPGSYEAFVTFLRPDDRPLMAVGRLARIDHPGVDYLWLGPVDIVPPSIPMASEAGLRESLGGPIR
ncbi:MAG: glycosyltransferase family 39 protein [Chloroflexota bacterium]|nr:glycosyltransferase family 39 protein [Chloroflexota bacterium]